MDHINAKRQKVDEMETAFEEAILFNSDTLVKIVSYLPSVDLLNLALTCKRFGISDDDNKQSLIEDSARVAIQNLSTEEQFAALPHYEGESSLADYHYLQLLREPLSFDQLVNGAEHVHNRDTSCVKQSGYNWGTAFSNNILRAGKHYVSFEARSSMPMEPYIFSGVMRPGQANESANGTPFRRDFYKHFSRNTGHGERNNNNNDKVHCCMYYSYDGGCYLSDWADSNENGRNWEGLESMDSDGEIGMLLDLDEGTLTVYKNRRKLGVMKRGLAGPYCWVVSILRGTSVTIKRGTIPPG